MQEEVLSLEQARQAQVKAALIDNASIQTIRTLERNMSALYTTARLEVKRKDEEILRLRKLYVLMRSCFRFNAKPSTYEYCSAVWNESAAVYSAFRARWRATCPPCSSEAKLCWTLGRLLHLNLSHCELP